MKATLFEFYVRNIYDVSDIFNAREEISRGGGTYGVNWKFRKVSKDEFLKEIIKDEKVCCGFTKSYKYVEVDKDNIDKFIL